MENKYPVFKKSDPPFLEKIKKNKRKIKSFVFKRLGIFSQLFFSFGQKERINIFYFRN
jgi:hypothetical protein